jgi:hypothetical protein
MLLCRRSAAYFIFTVLCYHTFSATHLIIEIYSRIVARVWKKRSTCDSKSRVAVAQLNSNAFCPFIFASDSLQCS